MGYDPQSETLEIEFLKGGIYEYRGVPEPLYEKFMQASSKGKFLHAYIKNRYPYTRIG